MYIIIKLKTNNINLHSYAHTNEMTNLITKILIAVTSPITNHVVVDNRCTYIKNVWIIL